MPGWRTNRKIVVFESDDWGSIRMPSPDSFERLEKAGVDLRSWDAERYNLHDTLETTADLSALFEILSGFKDSEGNHPVFTPLYIVANPDFEKIRNSGFSKYYFEPFTETAKKYNGGDLNFALLKEGIKNRIFVPEMHGREHLNVTAWLMALRNGDKQTHLAFNEGLWGFIPDQKLFPKADFQAAFLPGEIDELEYHKDVLVEGLDLFEKLFGYRASYFVAPNGPFHNSLNTTLAACGIKYRTTSKVQLEPQGSGKVKRVVHWLGQKDKSGIYYITRNCFFEPTPPPETDWVDNCLADIKIAFSWHKPAIISTHRVNYIGALNSFNRDSGLRQLKELIKHIIKQWPDVVFMTTAELGKQIEMKHDERKLPAHIEGQLREQ